MPQTPSNSLDQAEALLRAGNKEEARRLLIGYLDENPDSAKGWWLMSYAVDDFDQQFDCLERVLELSPKHRKAQDRLAALKGKTLPPKSLISRLKQAPVSVPIIALVLFFGCIGLMVIGYFGYQILFPVQPEMPAQAETAQILDTPSTAAAGIESSLAPTNTPAPLASAAQKATNTPLVSITPTPDPNATRTPIPGSQVGSQVGQYPPDFTLVNAVTNAEVNLHALFGQPLVIVFLNTLAIECEPEMPGLQAVYKKYQDQGLVVLGIGVGSSQSALRNYTGRFGGLSFPLMSDWEHEVAGIYEVGTLPTNIFVRKNGRIWQVSYNAMSESELNTVIASLLKVP